MGSENTGRETARCQGSPKRAFGTDGFLIAMANPAFKQKILKAMGMKWRLNGFLKKRGDMGAKFGETLGFAMAT
jgi:hypothetical protein